MNHAGAFDFSFFDDAQADTTAGVDVVSGTAPPSEPTPTSSGSSGHAPTIVVQDANLLFSGDYKRAGVDLVLSKDGHEHVVSDYFKGSVRAGLSSPDGATLTPELVKALVGEVQLAQLGGGANAAAQEIGTVSKLTGSATAIRNGVSVMLNVGDKVQKGDVVQAGADSSVGLTFIDGTVFGLSSNARMVLNEMVYDPNGSANSSLLSLVQGTITFVAGETAKHGDMRVDTPVATMGIRGTAVLVEIGFEVPGQGGAPPVKFQVLVEPGGRTGSYILYSKGTGQAIGTVNQAGQVTSISGNGDSSTGFADPLTPVAQALIQQTLQLYFPNYVPNPRGFGPNGGSSPADPNSGTSPDPLKFSPLDFLLGVPKTIPISVPGDHSNTPIDIIVTRFNTAPTIFVTPIVVTLPIDRTSFDIRDQVHITDPDGDDVATPYVPGTARIISATGPNGTPSSLDLKSLITVDPATGHVSYDPAVFAFLAAGQRVVYTIAFDSRSGPDTTHETLTFTVDGVNDAPVVAAPLSTSISQGDAAQTVDLLAGATDADLGETATLSILHVKYSVNGGTPSGNAPAGLTLNGTTLHIDPSAYAYLAKGQVATITVTYDVVDVNGAIVAQTETITVTGTNDAPVVSGPVLGTAIEDGPAVTLDALAHATDIDSGTILSVVNIPTQLPLGVTYNAATHSFTLDPTAYQYLAAGEQTVVTVTYAVFDGYVTTTASVSWTITGTNDAAIVSGTTTGTVTVGGETTEASGILTDTDVDNTPNTFQAVTTPTSTTHGYGTFTIDASGHWTFFLAADNPAVTALGPDDTLIETFTVRTADGTEQTITITISGPAYDGASTWTGLANNGNWNDRGNWSPAHVPGPNDEAVFNTAEVTLILSVAIEVGNMQVASGTTLNITGSGTINIGELTNNGHIILKPGTTIELTGDVQNHGDITIDDHVAGATMLIHDTVTLEGNGTIILDGWADRITGDSSISKLINDNNTIKGYGLLGDGMLSIFNHSDAQIIASDRSHALIIDTGAGSFVNHGLIMSLADGGLEIKGDLENTGIIEVQAGLFKIDGNLTGHGTAKIAGGIMEFGGWSDANVKFLGINADELILDCGSHFTGTVSGLSTGDTIDLKGISPWQLWFDSHDGVVDVHYGWGKNDYFTLTDPNVLKHLDISSDHHGGTEIVWNNDAPDLDASSADVSRLQDGSFKVSSASVGDKDWSSGENYTLDINGHVVKSGSLASIDHYLEDGFTFKPSPSDGSQATVAVTVTDGFGASDRVNFIFNTAPLGANTEVSLHGTDGKDVIFATANKDTLTGGAGADQFVFGPRSGAAEKDVITDFEAGIDKIVLDHIRGVPNLSGPFSEAKFALWQLSGGIEQRGANVLIHLDGGDTLQLDNVQLSHLHASDFIVHPYSAVA